MNINLNWTDLNPITKIDYEKEDYGVYIWGFVFENEFVPYYVGIAYNICIQSRLTDHVNNIIGGKYSIIHTSSLKTFYKHKNENETSDKAGKMYIPNWPAGYINFISNRKKYQSHIDNMVDRMHYSYAHLNDLNISKKEYELIEKKCIASIGIDKLINFRGGKADGISINKLTGDKRVTELFTNIANN